MNINLPELGSPDYDRRLRTALSDMLRDIDRRIRQVEGATWNGPHPILGQYHIWVDATGDVRIKSTPPTTDLDGTIIGTQS